MVAMSGYLRVRLLLTAAFLIAAGGAGVAYANAPSLVATTAGALLPSESPKLLGPITAEGRVGWACKPEQAAGAKRVHDAELPDDSTH
jgi:hypothetical protein